MKVEIIKCLQDNYSYLIIDEKHNHACVIDPSESEPVINFIENNNSFNENEWKELYKLSENTFVEETESLKIGAAGAGLTDND